METNATDAFTRSGLEQAECPRPPRETPWKTPRNPAGVDAPVT